MPERAHTSTADEALARQVGMARDQIRRSQWPVTLAHAFVAWVLWRDGQGVTAALWLLAITTLNAGRSVHLQRQRSDSPEHLVRAGRSMTWWLAAIGLLRPVPVLLADQHGSIHSQYLITMVMIGLTVGGAANLAGVTRLYLVWSAPLFAVLSAVWLARGGVEGVGIAVLLVMMFSLLGTYVRDYGRVLGREMALADSLRHERDRAEDAIVARTRFFAAASHDLRQPVAALRWYGEAVAEHARQLDSDRLAAIGEGIAAAVARAEPLLNQYLEISRLEAGVGALPPNEADVPAAVDITALLRDVRQHWLAEAERRGLQLAVDLEASSAAKLPALLVDEQALRRILDNLVGNALKFTAKGRVTLSARPISSAPVRWRLAVEDTGCGIAPEHHQRVFDDFFQVGNRGRSAEHGVGLGLAIARRYSERLGARLHVSSTPGTGSCFMLDLPVGNETAPESTQEVVESAPSAPPQHGAAAGARVLLVDDDEGVRRSLDALLSTHGWSVTAVAGLDDALRAWHDHPRATVVVLDHRLADGVTGAEVLARLRADGCSAPALFLTGDTEPQRLTDLAQLGIPVLHKPVSEAQLLHTLQRAAGNMPLTVPA